MTASLNSVRLARVITADPTRVLQPRGMHIAACGRLDVSAVPLRSRNFVPHCLSHDSSAAQLAEVTRHQCQTWSCGEKTDREVPDRNRGIFGSFSGFHTTPVRKPSRVCCALSRTQTETNGSSSIGWTQDRSDRLDRSFGTVHANWEGTCGNELVDEERPALERPDVADLAERARMHVTPDEIRDWNPKIGRIVDWFGQLQRIDLKGVAPATRPVGVSKSDGDLLLRPDVPRTFEERAAMLAEAPSMVGAYLKVPKIKTEGEP